MSRRSAVIASHQSAPRSPPSRSSRRRGRVAAQQKNDEEYTAKIKRVHARSAHHRPNSSITFPRRPRCRRRCKHFGHIIGAWGILDKSDDMNAYLAKIAKGRAYRAKYWTIGKSEEGRDMSVLVVGSEDIIKNLDKYKDATRRV